jgi:acyl-CoA thioester hydrolase
MISATAKVRVRYAETDRMGYVYYGNYATYYEVARGELMRKLGLSYVKFEADGYFLPIAEMRVKYIKPALYDELLSVKAILKSWRHGRLEFEYEVYNEKGELINTGYTLQVFVDGNTRRPTRPPQYFIEALENAEREGE